MKFRKRTFNPRMQGGERSLPPPKTRLWRHAENTQNTLVPPQRGRGALISAGCDPAPCSRASVTMMVCHF